ncbi:hypothetical protein [Flavobacterium humi]|uniref:Tetratricopeptide repeat protein n=1 Tax=Flavobacterium humi TaxID=2562683 RepID=A0A4Z0L8A4_9FLAO|nr:hypothetical protein [Flavobacterium humi]TGD57391.1 hypothetical protein E4635_12290 [Flavobacterium humi]
MKKILIALLLVPSFSYSQEKEIKNGTYISTRQTEKLKLNLVDGNKYELVFLYGNYEKKGDTLFLGNQVGKKSYFSAKFHSDAGISNKVTVKIKNKYITTFMTQIYVGTQDGSLPVQYKKLSELVNNESLDYEAEELSFTINRSQYLYLVYENYEGKTALSKYTVPNKVSGIDADFEMNNFGDIQLKAYYNKENNELVIADLFGKNPLAFKLEGNIESEIKYEVQPDEIKNLASWTYEGKDKDESGLGYAVADSAAAPKYDFKLKTENNLAEALKATQKAASKYLVLYYDPKNKNAQKEFDGFIQSQSTEVSYMLYDGYDAKYDLYNYYRLTDKDRSWIKKNHISESQNVIVVNSDGMVLSTSKGNLEANKNLFYYYDVFYSTLNRLNALLTFDKSIHTEKISDAALLKAFAQVSALDTYGLSEDLYAPEPPAAENTDLAATVVTVDETPQYKKTEVKLDKNQVDKYWQRLLKAYGKEANPNMELVAVISKEIKNEGFSRQFFGTEKTLNDTDFNAIEYLLKHYDAIKAEQNKTADSSYLAENIGKVISDALYKNNTLPQGEITTGQQQKSIEMYKRLAAKESDNLEINRNYFYVVSAMAEKLHVEDLYIDQYNDFFTKLFDGKTGIIEKIDELYTQKDNYNYESWGDFKNYFSNLSNEAAWFVVTKSNNPEHVKKAIKWSESSLAIAKNNAYYLDTLARLYYKNGEKEKAVKTQEQAVRYSEGIDEETKEDIEATLQKMKTGTY